jgi:hypothetical protein
MNAIAELTRMLTSGRLTCVGPKHFPAREYLGEKGWAKRIGKELRAPADRAALRETLQKLKTIHGRCGERFRIGVFGRSFLRILADLETSRDPRPSRQFMALVRSLLARTEGRKQVNRIRKMPQLENLIRFLSATLKA